MTGGQTHGIREERTSGKSMDLIYEEPDHTLVIYLELSGVPRFDWVGADTAFRAWTDPAGEVISEPKRDEIRGRVAEWADQEGVRIQFEPPIDLDAHLETLRQAGWSVEREDDGTRSATPPAEPPP